MNTAIRRRARRWRNGILCALLVLLVTPWAGSLDAQVL